MWDWLILPAMESRINALLRGNPALNPLAGKSLAIHCHAAVPFNLYVTLGANAISLTRHEPSQVDLRISGSPRALLRLARQGRAKDATVTGDMMLAQALQRLWQELDLDLEERLSQYCGDELAHAVGSAAQGVHQGTARRYTQCREDIREYLQEEKRLLLNPAELKGFYEEVDTLRDWAARLDAHLALLEKSC